MIHRETPVKRKTIEDVTLKETSAEGGGLKPIFREHRYSIAT